ncbi:hypothetical protein [Mariniphaga sediminis]|uniref:hypothetical protein n=1 Tax=Mariniphaga sediminis TaxID=1628158 RepID=UPI003564478A
MWPEAPAILQGKSLQKNRFFTERFFSKEKKNRQKRKESQNTATRGENARLAPLSIYNVYTLIMWLCHLPRPCIFKWDDTAGRGANFGFLLGFLIKQVNLLWIVLRMGKGQMRPCRNVERTARDGNKACFRFLKGGYQEDGKTGAGAVTVVPE